MSIPPWLRQPRLLLPVVVVAVLLGWLVARQGSDPEPPAATSRQPPPAAAVPVAPVDPQAIAAEGAPDIFAVRTWEPPAPPVVEAPPAEEVPPPPPPPPEAPPLPFRYLGKVEEAGRAPLVFLLRDKEILAVRPGDDINGTYRVVRLKNDELLFLYRPLKIEQALSTRAST